MGVKMKKYTVRIYDREACGRRRRIHRVVSLERAMWYWRVCRALHVTRCTIRAGVVSEDVWPDLWSDADRCRRFPVVAVRTRSQMYGVGVFSF